MSAIYYAGYNDDDYLMHHGTKGQKWGRRLYQNPDGSLTPLGRAHYGIGEARRKYQTYKEERIQKGIDKAIARGDADTLYKYRSRLTQQQITDAVNRINMTQRLGELTTASKKAKQQRDDAVTTVTNVIKKAGNLLNAYSGLTEAIQKIKDNSPEAKAKKKAEEEAEKEEKRIDNVKKGDEWKALTNRARQMANDTANKERERLKDSGLSASEIDRVVNAKFASELRKNMSGLRIEKDNSVSVNYKDDTTKNKPLEPAKVEKVDDSKSKPEDTKSSQNSQKISSTSISDIRKKLFENAEKYDKQKPYNANWGPKASVKKAQKTILSDKDSIQKEVNEQFVNDVAYQTMLERNKQKRRKVRIL